MASLNPDGLYKIEFPDFDAKFYCPSGFEDLSYHNDVMPHAGKRMKIDGKDVEINIWQDYEDKTKREYANTPRYIFQIIFDGDIIKEFKTDSLLQIKMYVGNLDNMLLALLNGENEMSAIKNITNKIIEGADVRETLMSSVELKEVVDFQTFYLKGDLYGIDRVVVVTADDKVDYSPRRGSISVFSGSTIQLISKFADTNWDYFTSAGDYDSLGNGKLCEFIVPVGTGEGTLHIGYFEDPNDEDYKSYKIDLENSTGWCRKIDPKLIKIK